MPLPPVDDAAKENVTHWELRPWPRRGLYLLFAFAGYLFTRVHLLNNLQFLDMSAYIAGTERLPFQRRVLPMLILRGIDRILPAASRVRHPGLLADPHMMHLFVLDLISLAVASYFCIRLHTAVQPHSRYRLLVFPIFLWTLIWTFVAYTIYNHYFPYDLMSVAFFAAGICFIYERRFLPLALVLLIGTINKETTLFLIPVFFLDALHPHAFSRFGAVKSIPWKSFPLFKTAMLFLLWLSVDLTLSHFYLHNDSGELRLRFRENLHNLAPHSLPQFFGACGFLLPVLWALRRRIPDTRIASYLLIVPLWIMVMFARGVLTETRIFGELCPLVAVLTVLLLEAYADANPPVHSFKNS
jgi:hypothetical protein